MSHSDFIPDADGFVRQSVIRCVQWERRLACVP